MDTHKFITYVDEMIEKYGYKRQEIAQRAGMSRDYVYKLLNGSKRTKERDYIIILCLAIGMTRLEMEKALELYHFPKLGESKRDRLINQAFDSSIDVDTLAGILLEARQPELVRGKIKSSKFKIIGSIRCKSSEVAEELFICIAEMRLRDEEGKMYYLLMNHGTFLPFGFVPNKRCTVLNRSLFNWVIADKGTCPPEHEIYEDYDTLDEAENSEFYPYFLKLKSAVDEELKKVEKEDDDTAFRLNEIVCGGKLENDGSYFICEAYEHETGVYIQVIEHNGAYIFSTTEESRFRYWELGDELFFLTKGYRKSIHFIEDKLSLADIKNSRFVNTYKKALKMIQVYIHKIKNNEL